MTLARCRLALVAACALSTSACTTTTEVRPDMVPAITAAAWGGAKIEGVVAGPRGRPVEIEGFLDTIAIERPGPDAPVDTFESPVAAAIAGGRLGLQDETRKRFYLPAEVARVEVTTSNKYATWRAVGWTLVVTGALAIGSAAIANSALRDDADPSSNGRRQAVSLPLVFGGAGLMAIGIPFAVKGYGEPETANPIQFGQR